MKASPTLITALAVIVYPKSTEFALRRGDTAFAAAVRQNSQSLTNAIRNQWRNDPFNRAYAYKLPNDLPAEPGSGDLWLAANGFALFADDLLTADAAVRLVDRVKASSLIAQLGLASQAAAKANIGASAFWYSPAGPAVEGLAKQNTFQALATWPGALFVARRWLRTRKSSSIHC